MVADKKSVVSSLSNELIGLILLVETIDALVSQ